MFGFGAMIQKLKADPKTIVLTEGEDPRILEAASRLLASNFLTPILLGDEEEVANAAEEAGYNIRGAQIINPKNYDRLQCESPAYPAFRQPLAFQHVLVLVVEAVALAHRLH